MPPEILVDLERVSARRPDRVLFESLSLTVSAGDRLGVVGINGTGKSTLLRVLAGSGEPQPARSGPTASAARSSSATQRRASTITR